MLEHRKSARPDLARCMSYIQYGCRLNGLARHTWWSCAEPYCEGACGRNTSQPEKNLPPREYLKKAKGALKSDPRTRDLPLDRMRKTIMRGGYRERMSVSQ